MGRRVTRQEFLLMSAGVGAGFVLAGCGGSSTDLEKAGTGGKSYNGPKVSLAFWNGFTGGDGPYMQKLVDQFNSQEKNINVSMSTSEWLTYYQKVPSAVQSGKGPDLGIMHIDQLPTNAARGVILALDDVANALKLKESDFVPVVWNAGVYMGKRYGIPLDIHPLGFYYNKGTMEKAGLDPDSPPQAEDDYMAALEELKGAGIQGHWMSPFLFTGGLTFQALLYQFGGQLYNGDATKATFNSDAGLGALTWMVDIVKEGYSPKDVAQDDEFTAFTNGDNAFMWNGIWQINALDAIKDLEWGAAQLPFRAPSVVLPAIWHFDARNFMYGLQIGADVGLVRLWDRLELNSVVKAGVFDNRVISREQVTSIGPFSRTDVFLNKFDEIAFVGEASLGGASHINDHFALRGGYQMLFLQDVATAINSFTEPEGLRGMFFHGAYAGLELRY